MEGNKTMAEDFVEKHADEVAAAEIPYNLLMKIAEEKYGSDIYPIGGYDYPVRWAHDPYVADCFIIEMADGSDLYGQIGIDGDITYYPVKQG